MERVEVINHKGKKVVYIDFSNLGMQSHEELRQTIANSKNVIKNFPPASVLTLTNFEQAHFSSEIIAEFKDYTAFNKPFVKKGAALGIQGLLKIVFDSVIRITGRNMPTFKSKEEALDWLVED